MNRRVALLALWVVFAGASVGVGFGAASLVGDPFTHAGTASTVTAAGAVDARLAGGPLATLDPTMTGRAPAGPTRAVGAHSAGGQRSGGSSKSSLPAGTDSASDPSRSATGGSSSTPTHAASGPSSRPSHHSGSGSSSPGTTTPSAGGGSSGGESGEPEHGDSPTPRSSSSTPPAPSVDSSRSISTRGGYVAGTCAGDQVTLSASPAVGWRIDEIRGGPSLEASVTFHQSGADGEIQVDASCNGGAPQFAVQDHAGDTGAPWGPAEPRATSEPTAPGG